MLVTLADMKAYLGIDSGDTSYDAFLTLQIQIISEAIESYCRRKFTSATYIQKFYYEEMMEKSKVIDTLQLYHYPTSAVSEVAEIEDSTSEITILAANEYRVNSSVAWVSRKNYQDFFQSGNIVQVTYTAGYTTIPFTIQNAVYSLVKERYNKNINGIDLNFGSDVQSISIPGTISVAYDYSLQNNERKTAFGAILGNYVNTLDYFRSERAVIGEVELKYVELD